MSCAACHMLLFLRAGHLGQLQNRFNLPSPMTSEPHKSGMSPRETPLLWALLPKRDLQPLCRQDALCIFCPPLPRLLSYVAFWRSGPAAANVCTLEGDPGGQRKSTCHAPPVCMLTPSPFPFQKLLWASCHAGDTPMINFDFHQFAKGRKLEKLENLLRPQLQLHWEDLGVFAKGENVSPR